MASCGRVGLGLCETSFPLGPFALPSCARPRAHVDMLAAPAPPALVPSITCGWAGICSPQYAVLNPMMKIEIQEAGDQVVLHVAGRLAGAFAAELENCWRTTRAAQPERKISVDLKNVTCVDRAGRYLLQMMHRNGVPFLRAGLAVQDILEQIMEQPECRH
jgi:anti-anti-sigma regulatory factor